MSAYGFSPAGVTNQTLNYIIWERNGQDAPFDGGQVISGSVPFPTPIDLPEGNPANEDHLILTDFELCPGDYYLTVYAANDSGGTLAANFAWFISAPNGINLIDPPGPATGAFGWRSALFPTPGFVVYQLPPTQLQQNPDFDPNDLYNTGFRITGGEGKTPCTPSCPEDLDGSGVIDGGDLGIVLAAWGNTGGPEDLDGSGTVDGGDLGLVLAAWGQVCP